MFAEDINKLAKENNDFRRVVHTGENSQLVLMSLKPGEDIGEEVHKVDQMLFFVDGKGEAILNGETKPFEKHDVIFVPAGTKHNFKNTGDESLKLFTVYAPSQHPDGTVHKTKEEAEKAEELEHKAPFRPVDPYENM